MNNQTTPKTLKLHLKFEYFDAIKAGEKREEFRLVSKWQKVLQPEGLPNTSAIFEKIELYRGYPKKGDTKSLLVRPWKGWTIKRIRHPHFGPKEVHVYAIVVN